MPVLSGEKQPNPKRRRRVLRARQAEERVVLLLLSEARTDVRRCGGRRRVRDDAPPSSHHGAAVAVRRAPEPGDSDRPRSAVRDGRRVEVVQLGRSARAPAADRPPVRRRAADHAQGARPSAGVRGTAAVRATPPAQERRRQRYSDKALQVVVQPVADPRVRAVQPVHAAAEEPLPTNETVQLAVAFAAQRHAERVILSPRPRAMILTAAI